MSCLVSCLDPGHCLMSWLDPDHSLNCQKEMLGSGTLVWVRLVVCHSVVYQLGGMA